MESPALSRAGSAPLLTAPKQLPTQPERYYENTTKHTRSSTTGQDHQKPQAERPRIRTSFLLKPVLQQRRLSKPFSQKAEPLNTTRLTDTSSAPPATIEVSSVGVSELLELLIDTSFGIASLAKNMPDASRVGTQVEEIKVRRRIIRSLHW